MLKDNAIRHQMILPEQQALFDHWRSLSFEGNLPRRADLDPAKLGPFLPYLSIVEAGANRGRVDFRFRLAGTGFWDIYNREIAGSWLSDLPEGSRRAYWHRVYQRVLETSRPSAGAGNFKVSGKSHMAQFWIRLPLYDEATSSRIILGFDKFIDRSRIMQTAPSSQRISA